MRVGNLMELALVLVTLCGGISLSRAQSINLWRGNEIKANWSDAYKWQLKHVPTGSEAILFREDNSVVAINSTIDLENGIQLYGQELSFEGNGNLNLRSPVPHQSTVYVPASASGYANLTLNDNLSINGNIALSAKAFGTSASKGSITLKDRTTISGSLLIGNNGSGSGKVLVHDQAIYHIYGLELNTKADQGGLAEIHILGGMVELEIETDPFVAFLEDPSRKIIIGDAGTLRIQSDWTIARKKQAITEMISQKRLTATRGCELTTPIFQKNLILIKAECTEAPQTLETLLAQITQSNKTESEPPPVTNANALVGALKTISKTTSPSQKLVSQLKETRHAEPLQAVEGQPEYDDNSMPPQAAATKLDSPVPPLVSYIAFFSTFLLLFRPAKPVK